MKLFSFLKGEEIRPAPGKKIIAADEFSTLLSAQEILTLAQEQSLDFRQEVAQECEKLKEQAEHAGFEEGLKKWNHQIAHLEEEIRLVRKDMEDAIVPLALAAIKKIIGRELELKPETTVDIIATALKTVSQHRRVSIYVNKNDLEIVEAQRSRLKEIFENLHSLSIAPREDIERGGCVIETESGIINAQLNHQLNALENAFHAFLHMHKRKDGG